VLEKVQETVVRQAIDEGFIIDDMLALAIDATHFEARDQAPTKKEEKSKPIPKKRGRKSKAEREQWLKEQAKKEAQLDASLSELRYEVPQDPKWGIKKIVKGKCFLF